MEKITFKNFPYKTTPLNDANLNQLQTNVENAIDEKVSKVEGKGLSTNDYTTTEKNKLAGIEPGANKTIIADNLTTDDSARVLSAKMGKKLNDKLPSNLTSTKLTLGNWEIEEDSTTGNLKFSVVSE